MIRTLMLAATLAAALPGAASAAPQSKARSSDSCFDLTQMQGDVPINDHTVLFRVNVDQVYALDFADRCPALAYPDPKLIIVPAGGITFVCHAIDLNVRVGQNEPGDIPIPCIPTGLRRLSPAEVAALPKKDIP